MKNNVFHIIVFIWFLVCLSIMYSVLHAAPAFPDAKGFGKNTTGGRAGSICAVTNTNDSGAGSFSSCLSQGSARVIYFRTGGVISNMGDIPDNTTILGQTAPGGGIAFQDRNISIGDNVIIRGIRLFVDSERNGINIARSSDMIIDHSSIAWVGNEAFSSWQNSGTTYADDFTLSYSVIYEGLKSASGACASDGNWEAHAMQLTPCNKCTIYRNMMINTDGRAPHITGPVSNVEFVNNISMQIANAWADVKPRNSGLPGDSGVMRMHFISNLWAPGGNDLNINDGGVGYVNGSALYMSDNNFNRYNSKPLSDTLAVASSPISGFGSLLDGGDIVSRSNLESTIIDVVGPVPRDQYLSRAIADYESNNKHYQCPNNTPSLSFASGNYETTHGTDTDSDGIPDAWETANGLNPNSSSDADDLDGNGYMYLEAWAHTIFTDYTPPDPPDPEPVPDRPAWFKIETL